ncbi:hydrogenase maturation protease [Actinomadura scrupuli]|uniref:hydrogenase maturation protease n=1 Tax=Actinomadura scrupuli TaxID=559629 RepID=UPI003D979CE7
MKTLVAGVGNIFLGDDGFGVEVARRLSGDPARDGVRVADYGIRGLHLAYELLDGYDALILVDAVDRGGPPGTVYVIEPGPVGLGTGQAGSETGRATGGDSGCETGGAAGAGSRGEACGPVDGHGLTPEAVLRMLAWLGGGLDRVLVVGCQVADVGEGIGLSPPVAGAVDDAAGVVRGLLDDLLDDLRGEPRHEPCDEPRDGPRHEPRDETTGKAGPPCSRSF